MHDYLPVICLTGYFIQAQGYEIEPQVVFQDNKSAILLAKSGRRLSSCRTCHMNIRYFLIKDRITQKEIRVEYCPTDEMVADYFTKPLTGKKFFGFRKVIMGEENVSDKKDNAKKAST